MTAEVIWYGRDGEVLEKDYARIEQLLADPAYTIVVRTDVGDASVWTVWLGLDHRFAGNGPPLIFETMIFGGQFADDMWRYSDEKRAREHHAAIVRALQAGRDPREA